MGKTIRRKEGEKNERSKLVKIAFKQSNKYNRFNSKDDQTCN